MFECGRYGRADGGEACVGYKGITVVKYRCLSSIDIEAR